MFALSLPDRTKYFKTWVPSTHLVRRLPSCVGALGGEEYGYWGETGPPPPTVSKQYDNLIWEEKRNRRFVSGKAKLLRGFNTSHLREFHMNAYGGDGTNIWPFWNKSKRLIARTVSAHGTSSEGTTNALFYVWMPFMRPTYSCMLTRQHRRCLRTVFSTAETVAKKSSFFRGGNNQVGIRNPT